MLSTAPSLEVDFAMSKQFSTVTLISCQSHRCCLHWVAASGIDVLVFRAFPDLSGLFRTVPDPTDEETNILVKRSEPILLETF